MKACKVLFVALLVSVIAMGSVMAAGASEKGGASLDGVAGAIAAAEKMSLAELEAAAKAEFEAAGLSYNARGITSGFKKVLAGFQGKYPWFKYEPFSSSKDQALYTELTTAIGQNQYVADIAMLQDGSSLQSLMLDTGYLLNYVPQGIEINAADQNPLTGLYVNKNFLWNKTAIGSDYLQNVWQLTGADGAKLKGIHQLSFQNPATENINMSFLIMLTSEEACQKLAKAYESYFGAAYAGNDGYKNIGYKFLTEFIKNVSTWHSSDTTAVKNLVSMTTGQIIYGPLNKVKDYPATSDYRNDLAITGWNTNIEGFDSYFYKMWIMIPSTAKLPYTSCLLIEYFFTPEGFTKGWSSEGYYSINPAVPVVEGDHTLSEWNQTSIVENIDYINSVYKEASTYIRSLVTV